MLLHWHELQWSFHQIRLFQYYHFTYYMYKNQPNCLYSTIMGTSNPKRIKIFWFVDLKVYTFKQIGLCKIFKRMWNSSLDNYTVQFLEVLGVFWTSWYILIKHTQRNAHDAYVYKNFCWMTLSLSNLNLEISYLKPQIDFPDIFLLHPIYFNLKNLNPL